MCVLSKKAQGSKHLVGLNSKRKRRRSVTNTKRDATRD
jgi:hypothetical protein